MLTILGIGTLALVILACLGDEPKDRMVWAFGFLSILVALMGSILFLADHQGQSYRYFAERPVSPRLVWLSRQVSWLTVISLWLMVVAPIWIMVVFRGELHALTRPFHLKSSSQVPMSYTSTLGEAPAWLALGVFLLLAYAAGQVCSTFLRSGVLSGVLGVALTIVLFCWAAAMEWVGVSWLLAAAPIPIIALFITWCRMSDWIGERSGPRTWLRSGLSFVLPVAAMIAIMAVCRVALVPVTSPGFSLQKYAAQVTPEARKTAEMYLRAGELLTALDRSRIYDLQMVQRRQPDRPDADARAAGRRVRGRIVPLARLD